MKDSIAFILQLPLKIYVFRHIYIFLPNRLYPELQKQYLPAKRDLAARGKGHLTLKSAFLNLQQEAFTLKSTSAVVQKDISTLKSVFAAVHIAVTTLKSVSAVVQKDISTLKSVSAVVQKYFSTLNSVSAVLQKDFSRRKVFLQSCKKTFQHGKVFLQQFGYMIRTWNSIYAALHIYYAASRSLSAALLIYIKTTIRYPPFLNRNFPMIMRFIYNRKQYVSS